VCLQVRAVEEFLRADIERRRTMARARGFSCTALARAVRRLHKESCPYRPAWLRELPVAACRDFHQNATPRPEGAIPADAPCHMFLRRDAMASKTTWNDS